MPLLKSLSWLHVSCRQRHSLDCVLPMEGHDSSTGVKVGSGRGKGGENLFTPLACTTQIGVQYETDTQYIVVLNSHAWGQLGKSCLRRLLAG